MESGIFMKNMGVQSSSRLLPTAPELSTPEAAHEQEQEQEEGEERGVGRALERPLD